MSPSQVDQKALLAAVRVQTALDLIPRIATSKETRAPWMRDNLSRELDMLSNPSTLSPHPKILGSLTRVLFNHFSGGMGINTLCFGGTMYVDVPPATLPKLQSSSPDYWWNSLSLSVESILGMFSLILNGCLVHLKVPLPTPSPVVRSDAVGGSSSKQACGVEVVPKRKNRVARKEAPPKRKRARVIIDSDDDDTSEAGPSTSSGLAEPRVQPEPSEDTASGKICGAGRSRGSECVWPVQTRASQNEKRACRACVSQKTRCNIEGVFSIRRLRGKAAKSQPSLPHHSNNLNQSDMELSKLIMTMRQQLASDAEETLQLTTMVSYLAHQVSELKGKAPKP